MILPLVKRETWGSDACRVPTTITYTFSDETAAAGGDLFMPGSSADMNRMLQAMKNGKLSRHQMEVNATRVLRAIRRCRSAE